MSLKRLTTQPLYARNSFDFIGIDHYPQEHCYCCDGLASSTMSLVDFMLNLNLNARSGIELILFCAYKLQVIVNKTKSAGIIIGVC